jgi:hypothetical protein
MQSKSTRRAVLAGLAAAPAVAATTGLPAPAGANDAELLRIDAERHRVMAAWSAKQDEADAFMVAERAGRSLAPAATPACSPGDAATLRERKAAQVRLSQAVRDLADEVSAIDARLPEHLRLDYRAPKEAPERPYESDPRYIQAKAEADEFVALFSDAEWDIAAVPAAGPAGLAVKIALLRREYLFENEQLSPADVYRMIADANYEPDECHDFQDYLVLSICADLERLFGVAAATA